MVSRVIICRVLASIAILLCGILFASDSLADVRVCGFSGECDEVRASEFGKWFGIPLPIWGFVGYGIILLLTLQNFKYDFVCRKFVSIFVFITSIYFLVVQFFVIQKICHFCLVIDLIGIVCGILFFRFEHLTNSIGSLRFIWLPTALALFILPFGILIYFAENAPPSQVTDLWVKGKINIVEVTDFDCEYCRKSEVILESIKDSVDVNFVRIVAPMPKHANSRIAGRAFLAAKEMGMGEEMATELFRAKVRDREECRRIALKLGLKLVDFDRLLDDPEIDRHFDATIAWARAAGSGLPMIWVNSAYFAGTPDPEEFDSAIKSARKVIRSR